MVDRILPTYTALCVISLFIDLVYKVGGMALRPFDAMVAIGLFLIVASACVRGRIRPFKKANIFYLFIVLYAYRMVNGLLLSSTGVAIKEGVQAAEFVVFIYMVGMATNTAAGRRKFLRRLFWGLGIVAVLTAAWHISQGEIANYKRLDAPKHTFALFALLSIPIYLHERTTSRAAIMGFAISLAVLSGERKGWVALAAAAAVIYVIVQDVNVRRALARLFRPRIVVASSVLIIAGVIFASQFEYVGRQFASMYDIYLIANEAIASGAILSMDLSQFDTSGSNLARLYILLFAVRATLSHPLLGVGTGRWHDALNQMARSDDSRFMVGAHGEYQRFAVENGLTGLVMYTTLWVASIRKSIRIARGVLRDRQAEGLTIVGVAIYGTFINLFLGGGALNTIYLALAVGLILGVENDEKLVHRQPKSALA